MQKYSGVTAFDIAIVCAMVILTGLMAYGFGWHAGVKDRGRDGCTAWDRVESKDMVVYAAACNCENCEPVGQPWVSQ